MAPAAPAWPSSPMPGNHFPMRIAKMLPGLFLVIASHAALLLPSRAEDRQILADLPHVVLAPGKTQTLEFRLLNGGGAASGLDAKLVIGWPDARKEEIPLQSRGDGRISVSVAAPAGMPPGEAEMALQVPEWKQELALSADIMDLQAFAKAEALAASISLTAPVRILFLGDSLTAQRAGRNQVDKLRFWLEKFHPGMTTIRNAAVGGDNIRIVARRIQHMADPASRAAQFRQETYDGLFEFQPSLIFIALGQNDTKVTSASGYRKTHLTPDEWRQGFITALDAIEAKTSALIVLVTPVSPVEEICRRRAADHARTGKAHLMFGKPAAMESFNEFLKTLAKDRRLAVCDFYTPTRNHPDKPSLFRPDDGLHLTLEGNRFLALQYLEYFASRRE